VSWGKFPVALVPKGRILAIIFKNFSLERMIVFPPGGGGGRGFILLFQQEFYGFVLRSRMAQGRNEAKDNRGN